MALKGYAWLPDLRRKHHGRPFTMRLAGRRTVAISGPDAVRFFYEPGHLERRNAVPPQVLDTLFGRGAVHTLDGEAHRVRKALFVDLLLEDGADTLAKLAGEAFDDASERWRAARSVTLFDEAAGVIADAVTRWTGVREMVPAADLVAMVDGFASAGPRQLRARQARRRQEAVLSRLIEDVRREEQSTTPISRIAHHREDGRLLDAHTAAVELLNIIRPATAVAWYVAFAAHALDRWPENRAGLTDDDFTRAFVHELRRYYPFAPFVPGIATDDLRFHGQEIPRGTLVLLDIYGQHHDSRVWARPYEFRPERFLGRPAGEFELIPQGGGDPRTGHRCPGETITVALLGTLVQHLVRLGYYLPPQDTSISLSRIPARVRSGIEIVVP
ncbi:cytochrome P450 [Actinoplanes sp. TBRC 11911]|uniref:cytochrome P450 n=1 Tax=Actinoplanes sp. TBRC 11911 TaxID=2729386 RepID=UPI0020071563|nr:cytochrome P450 [Actinoplanes sp. TBRC 11911]